MATNPSKARIRETSRVLRKRIINATIRLRDLWSPSIRYKQRPGSLYEFVIEEQKRIRAEAQRRLERLQRAEDKLLSRSHLRIGPDTPNYAYMTHCLVATKINACTFAAEDVDKLFTEGLADVYAGMATWMGKPPEAELNDMNNYLTSDLPVSQVLSNIQEVLRNLEESDPQLFLKKYTRDHQSPLEIIHPLFLELGKLGYQIDSMKKSLSKALEDVSPVMNKFLYDEYLHPHFSKSAKSSIRIVASEQYESSICYDQIKSQDSVSTISSAPIPEETSKQKLRAEFKKLWNFIRCVHVKDGDTEVIMSPFVHKVISQEQIPDMIIVSDIPVPEENAILEDNTSMEFITENREPIKEESTCGLHEERTEPQKCNAEGLKSFLQDVKSSVSRLFPHGKTFLNKDGDAIIPLPPPSSFQFDMDQVKIPVLPESPNTYFERCVLECRKTISIAEKIMENLTKKFYSFPFDGMKSDANVCKGIVDLLNIMYDKGDQLEVLKNDDVYSEEMRDVKVVINRAYKSGLKFLDLLEEYKVMVHGDEGYLWNVIQSCDPNLQQQS